MFCSTIFCVLFTPQAESILNISEACTGDSAGETEYLQTLSLQAKKKVRTADEIPRISKFLSSNAMWGRNPITCEIFYWQIYPFAKQLKEKFQ